MKKITLIAAGVLMLASVAAYAQVQHRHSQGQPGAGMMHSQMHGQMHGQKHRQMHGTGSGDQHAGHAGHGADSPQGDRGPSSLAFHGINLKMHEGMNIAFTGNVDADFVNGMIPHHQGAVDMAKVVLAFGGDPEIRKLAQAIIQSQEGEIAMMRAWLKRNAQ